jgi:Tol biopolymer transport system component
MRSSLKLQLKVFSIAIAIASGILALNACKNSSTLERKPAQALETPREQTPKELGYSSSPQDPGLITGMKQLTFEGPRAGEGYFSRDGKKMIFQSERYSGNPFYQIYVMDLETGKTQLVSTGKGKTTCAWIHPNQKKVMFASTHLDPEFSKKVQQEYETRKSPQKNKYSWSYDENFDLFEADLNGKNTKRLTREKGYDAEGDYSPDGKQIVFASNRSAYTQAMSAEDQKIFDQDSSYMMDIYIMNADGSNVRRLTNTKGYDGGPFFSQDGQKITWRRFSPNGQTAEVFTMNVDGSDEKQLTHLGSMSWAPYFHPSGDYLIFTSNVLGFSNFELFIVDAKGEKKPVRVSYFDGFDGLPVFSPDGNKISWTRKNEKGESQIYIAPWDDQKARELLGLESKAPEMRVLSGNQINIKDAKSWVTYLASEHLAGRLTGSPEEKEYAAKLSEAFKQLALVPAVGTDFLVPFTFTSGVELGPQNTLKIQSGKQTGQPLVDGKVSEDFIPLSFSKTGDFASAPVVFVGYGIIAPASDSQPAYDSFKGLDVKGKWVLAFRDIPEKISNEKRIHLNLYSRIQHKALVAKNQGALGLLLVNGPNSFSQKLPKLRYDGALSETSIPVLSLSNAMADLLVQNSGKTLKQWQDQNDSGEIVNGDLTSSELAASVDLKFKKSTGLNVVAKLPIKGARSSVLVGAHGDHLGRGEMGSSLAKNGEQGQIHFGADDNASGVAGVMEIAKALSLKVRSGKLKLKQNLIFAVWSGEEIGLLGSAHFAKNWKEPLTANLNMDMIGRLQNQLVIQGAASAKEWKSELERVAAKTDLSFTQQDDPYVPSDGMTFYMKQIPSLTFFTGSHAEYHSPRDKVDTINFPGLVKVAELVEMMTVDLAKGSQALTYQKVESSHRKLDGRSFRIYLGTIPDYTQDGVKGVKISGTSKDSPAEKAGLKPGDVIVELANSKVENLYDYVYCLQAMKANQETTIKINRQGQLMNLKILPSMKE